MFQEDEEGSDGHDRHTPPLSSKRVAAASRSPCWIMTAEGEADLWHFCFDFDFVLSDNLSRASPLLFHGDAGLEIGKEPLRLIRDVRDAFQGWRSHTSRPCSNDSSVQVKRISTMHSQKDRSCKSHRKRAGCRDGSERVKCICSRTSLKSQEKLVGWSLIARLCAWKGCPKAKAAQLTAMEARLAALA